MRGVWDVMSSNSALKMLEVTKMHHGLNLFGLFPHINKNSALKMLEGDKISFSCFFFRSDREFLYQILGEVIKAGETTLNIPDTFGYTLPTEFGELIADIKANTPGVETVIISTHCQNDLGLSTANTIAGKRCARQLEVTINGIGERAGNASLEEVVMALKCRGEQILYGLYTWINTQHIIMASKMPHKAIVGANAFAHESGLHQDGMLKHKNTYEIISPEDIGLQRSSESGIVLGKLRLQLGVSCFWLLLHCSEKCVVPILRKYGDITDLYMPKEKKITGRLVECPMVGAGEGLVEEPKKLGIYV
ncbi:hypothetical protein CASFOL_028034 [Castilleja foliolosa]|uniref:Pyruvate carboxyltransferase domain-containing protein n=1 Tax=Castilleja foliolosa TaxID=1961234 RepID=A0ABD3CGH7_9LAMI